MVWFSANLGGFRVDTEFPAVVIHLDESCLGNGRTGSNNPGGAGGLLEVRGTRGIQRRDFTVHALASTNNRMALLSAISALKLLSQRGQRVRVLIVSDSEYLVKGVREWLPDWHRRGWTRKSGAIENLGLWQELWGLLPDHDAQFVWVRGHVGHPKNEYANDLAVTAARQQQSTDGLVESGFLIWLAGHRSVGRYQDYDPDAAFSRLEQRLLAGERFARKAES